MLVLGGLIMILSAAIAGASRFGLRLPTAPFSPIGGFSLRCLSKRRPESARFYSTLRR